MKILFAVRAILFAVRKYSPKMRPACNIETRPDEGDRVVGNRNAPVRSHNVARNGETSTLGFAMCTLGLVGWRKQIVHPPQCSHHRPAQSTRSSQGSDDDYDVVNRVRILKIVGLRCCVCVRLLKGEHKHRHRHNTFVQESLG